MFIPSPKNNSMQQIRSLDLARGFTVFMIAPVHTMLLYSKPYVRETLLGKIFAFVAEGPGAQLFMIIMGILFALSTQKSFNQNCKRALFLLLVGYALNITKFVLPHYFSWLPISLLHDLDIDSSQKDYIELLSIGDILQFAAFATIALHSIARIKYAEFVSLCLALAYCILSPYFWDIHFRNDALDYLSQLFGGAPPRVFFPFFPWIVYPLIGLSIGIFIKKSKDPQPAFWVCRDVGWCLIICATILTHILPIYPYSSFYRTYPFDTLIHIGIVLVTLSLWQWIAQNVKPNNLFDVLTYLSQNITSIYIIQWILICWLLPLIGYQQLGTAGTLCAIATTSFLTISLSFFFKKGNKKEKHDKIPID